MARSGDRSDLLAAGLEPGPVREQFASEISDDAMWVAAARDGDRAAFGQLYERYSRMVHGVLLSKVAVGDVEDLVQDVFIRALRRLSTLRETASFGAWLAAIARNVANDYHRQSVPEEPLTDDASDHEIHCGVSGGDQDGPAAAILEAVLSLSQAYRETLILRLVEGMTGPEIAARTGMTHGSVRVNLHRGMEQLRAKLSARRGRVGPEQEKSQSWTRGIIEPKTDHRQKAATTCGTDLVNPILRSRGWKDYSGSFAMTHRPRSFPRSSLTDDGNSSPGGFGCSPL